MRLFRLCLVFVLWWLGGYIYSLYVQRDELPVFPTPVVSESAQQERELTQGDYSEFDAVYWLLADEYYQLDDLDRDAMEQRAIKSYVDALGDPFTVFLNAVENDGLRDWLTGEEDFEGIWAVVTKKDEGVLIEQVLKDSPASRAGLQPLDLIIKIADDFVYDETITESVARIRGPAGSEVELTILRKGRESDNPDTDEESSIFTVIVTRDAIVYPSVSWEVMEVEGHNVWYIVISSVGNETVRLFRDAVEWLQDAYVEWYILDVRGNGGGFLVEAVDILSYLIPQGETVVTWSYRTYKDDIFVSHGYRGLQDIPSVVLVDWFTASAGEIIALALHDILWVSIVGTSSFGKGTIQTLSDFADGSSLKMTIGEWLPPSGVSINEVWITPEVMIEFDAEQYYELWEDNQLKKAEEILINQL